jgi:FAD-dependent urate hydroxylase
LQCSILTTVKKSDSFRLRPLPQNPIVRPTKYGEVVNGNSVDCDVAIVGAGPYGLSAAAHLHALGVDTRVFGQPMQFWATGMPPGMLLRSPRVASTISDPGDKFTLEAYEQATGTKPVKRVPGTTFVSYGRWFQKQMGANHDSRHVTNLRREGSIFKLTLEDGTVVTSNRVVVAAGIGPFYRNPKVFSELCPCRASHCYEGKKFAEMGKRIAVIGAGQSALECGALLHEAGVDVEIIARIPTLRWIGMHPRLHNLGFISKTLYSKHDIGPIGISRLVAYPNLLYHFPMASRDKIRTRAVRSAGAPWLIPRLDNVKITTGRSVVSAKEVGTEVELKLDDGSERRVDHVLMGTGYRVDLASYKFLDPALRDEIRQLDGYPDVTAGFCTSVPGLHFTGAPAARKFGPLFYFVTGTEWASTELANWFRRHRN